VPRYGGWRRLVGDTDRPDLLNLGKQLLGYLEEQRANGAPKTLVKEVTTPDGSRVRARFVYDLPIIEVLAGGKENPGIVANTVEGFIARPSPTTDQSANEDKNHVLLRPDHGAWNCAFYDADHVPPGYESSKLYNELFPDGIGRYGNVDWRSADESVHVSWMGPSARYAGFFASNFALGPCVFYQGRVLFDADNPDHVDPLGIDDFLRVRGACIRPTTNWLYLALRGANNVNDHVVRYKLVSPAMQEAAKSLGILDAPACLFGDAQIDPASGEVLMTAPIETFDGPHPFFFNTDGTEARRIYADTSAQVVREIALQEVNDRSWQRVVLQEHSYSVTKTTTMTRTLSPPGSYSYELRSDALNTSGTKTHAWFIDTADPPHTVEFDGTADIVTVSRVDTTESPSAEKAPVAVDYWDGQWRYAESLLRNTSHSCTFAVTPNITSDRHDQYALPDVPVSNDFTLAPVFSVVATKSGVTGGLVTPFVRLQAETTVDHSGGMQYSYSEHFFDLDPNTSSTVGQRLNKTLDRTFNVHRTSRSQTLSVAYLDLRFDILYYTLQTSATDLVKSAESHGTSASVDGADPTVTGNIGIFDDIPLSGDSGITTSTTYETTVIVGGGIIDQYQKTTSSTSPFIVNTLSGAVAQWLFNYIGTEAFSPSGIQSVSLLGANFSLSSEDNPDSPTDAGAYPWHDYRMGDPASNTAGETVSVSHPTPVMPGPSSFVVTRDFLLDTFQGYGSWLEVKNNWIAGYENEGHRPVSTPDRTTKSNLAGLDTLLSATGAARLNPVGYLSKTIVVRSAR